MFWSVSKGSQPKGNIAVSTTMLSACEVDIGAAGGGDELAAVLAREGSAGREAVPAGGQGCLAELFRPSAMADS
ncbi:hypothetical protein AB0C38_11285 [Amycolatopsis sp. NPDC048633]|uniref:hypothetical protein n=1 Tax=Amycolatopsis sp. NPDC048633 TaxID=3157095 RepID=UPI0033D4076F